ncbi:MAG: 3-deoxy-7-phosphoheptulonate synthase [Vulcanimicrobiaceae bacterium]
MIFGGNGTVAWSDGKQSPRKTSLILSVANRAGTLAQTLTQLAQRGINVSKLESKPRLGHSDEHTFYIDVEGDINDAVLREAIAHMQREAKTLVVLGSYDAYVGAPADANGSTPSAHSPRADTAPHAEPPQRSTASSAFPLVARASRPNGTVVRIGTVAVGDGSFTIVAGPCSVESREQILSTARGVGERGAVMLRGGAFKPRTSPYAFQGLGWDGVDLLAEAGRATGLPTVSEVMTIDQVERMAERIDVLQIGARNMQNFDLLKAVGRAGRPVLLKRGLSATIDELLAAAEYILSEGNPNVILCERGIRTFEPSTRNTLDLSAVPVLRERTHLPIFVDPSHGVGVRRWVRPLSRAAKAVGADGLLIEVHSNPPEAKSDKEQALTFEDFAQIVADLERIPLERPSFAVVP